MFRKLAKGFGLLLLGLAVVIGVAVVAFRPALYDAAGIGVESLLAARGFGPASVEIRSVGLARAVVGPVRLGGEPGISFSRLNAAYSLNGLLVGHIDRLSIAGLRVSAALTDGRLSTAPPSSEPSDPSSPPQPLPFGELDLQDAELALTTDWGVIHAGFDGTVDPGVDGALSVDGRLRLGHADGGAAGRTVLTYSPDGSLNGRLELDTGSIETSQIAVHLVGADIDFSRDADALPSATADLHLARAIVPQAAFGPTRLKASFDGGKLRAEADFRLAGGEASGRLTLDALDVVGPAPTADLSGEVTLSRLGGYAATLGLAEGADARGRLAFEVHGAGPELLRPADWLVRPGALPAFEGWVDAALDRADLPGMVAGLAADGRLDIRAVDDGLEAHVARELTLSAADIPLPAWRQAADVVTNLHGPVALTVAADGDRTLLLRVTTAGSEWQVLGGAAVRLATAGTDLLWGRGAYRLDRTGGEPWRASVPTFSLQSAEFDIAGRRVRVARATGTLHTNADGFRADIDTDIRANGPDLRDAALSLAGRADWRDTMFRFDLARCAVAAAKAVRAEAVDIAADRLEICAADGRPVLTVADIGLDAARLAVALRTKPTQLRADMTGDAETPLTLLVDLPDLSVAGDLRLADRQWTAAVSGRGIGVEVPAFQVAATDIGLTGNAAGGPAGLTGGRAEISSGVLRDRRAAPLFAPIGLSATVDIADAVATFRAEATDRTEALTINAEGRHRLTEGIGTATVAAEPMLFSPDGLQPQSVLPVLRGQVSSVTGGLRMQSSLAWDRDGLRSELDLALEDIGLQTAFAALAGITGDVAFDSLLPPATPPHQQIAVGLLDVGLPLNDGTLDFTLGRDGRLQLHAAEWPWAGGRLFVRDAVLDPAAARQDLVLSAADVNIAELLEQLEVPDLTATGRFSGRIPVTIEGEKATIRNARLTTGEAGGVIRYRDQAAKAALAGGGESGELLIAALEDFRYESLVVELNGETDGNIDVLIHLRGANPQVYEGYPFELNLTLGGELLSILRRGLAGYQAPDRIRKQLEIRK